MKRIRLDDESLLWAAYLTIPAESRLAATPDMLTAEARATWLRIGRNLLANGWQPGMPYPSVCIMMSVLEAPSRSELVARVAADPEIAVQALLDCDAEIERLKASVEHALTCLLDDRHNSAIAHLRGALRMSGRFEGGPPLVQHSSAPHTSV